MKAILCVGELLMDVIPSAPLRLEEACYAPYPGGAVANVAVAIARLGGSARFVGAVSDDAFGQLLVPVLTTNHVDTRYIQCIPDAPTTIALVTLQTDGQRTFTFFRQQTADSLLQPETLNWNSWDDVAICHVGGVLLSTEPARSATLAAIEHTRQAGSLVSFDVNIRPSLWDSPTVLQTTISDVIERSDVLKLSIEEIPYVRGLESFSPDLPEKEQLYAAGNELLDRGPRLIMITLGAQGTLLFTPSHRIEVPALAVNAVDTTGAGDAYMGAALYQLVQFGCQHPSDLEALSQQQLHQMGIFASYVAGLSCTRYGGISSFPFLHEVQNFSAS